MLKNTRVMAAAFIGLGMLLGYAAASGYLNPAQWAWAGQSAPAARTAQSATAGEAQPGCCDGVSKGEFVALLTHNTRVAAQAEKAGKKPNVLIIWGDDIGVHNVSAYNHGIMGYRTPNIDRLAKEGALFTDAYGEQSCTAGRAAFI